MNIAKPCFAEEIKKAIKHRNWLDEMRAPSRCMEEALEKSRKTWTMYEQVNRDYCPDDPVYSNVRAGAALSTTADHIFFKAAAAGQGRILEIIIGGEATSSAVNRVGVAQMNATLANNANVTPEKFNSRSPAAAGTYGNANTSAIVAGNMLVLAFNAFGGFIRWVAAPGEELYYVNSEVISLRSLSGTSTCSSTGIFEEL
jgi:hypothetical protein